MTGLDAERLRKRYVDRGVMVQFRAPRLSACLFYHEAHEGHEAMTEEEVAREIVDAALAVHRALGPGLLESAYEQCLVFELNRRGVAVERQKEVPIVYQGMRIDAGYRIDLLVGGSVIVELKALDRLAPVHDAQLLSYLRLANLRIGFLINFHVRLLKDGIRRLIA